MSDEFNETDLDTPTEADLESCYGSKYLSAADVGNKKIRTRIAKVRKEMMRQQSGGERPRFVITFTTLDKPMVLNSTNMLELTSKLGKVPANWMNADIGLFTENTQFGGRPVKGLRLRALGPAKIAAKAAPAKTPIKAEPAKPVAAKDLEEGPWADPEDAGFNAADLDRDFGEAAE
jgi:hypothetical protein